MPTSFFYRSTVYPVKIDRNQANRSSHLPKEHHKSSNRSTPFMRFPNPSLSLLALMIGLFLVACYPAPASGNIETLIVAPEQVECIGFISPQECLQVKNSSDEEWRWFYDDIQGFTYQSGYIYELRVRSEKIENPPTDGSGIRWILVEEVSKTAVATLSPQEPPIRLISRPWVLVGFGDGTALIEGTEVTLNLRAEGIVEGNASLNHYNGTFITDGATLTFSQFTNTDMGGDPALMNQESAYLALLERTATYKVLGPTTLAGASLTLFDEAGTVLLVFQGPRV
jgi:heat shock protein HslJ